MTARTALPLVLTLLVLTACGEEDASATDASTADATQDAAAGADTSTTAAATPAAEDCPWITNVEATDVLGAPVTVTRPAGNQAVCQFSYASYTSGAPSVGIVVRDGGFTLDQMRSPFDDMGTAEAVEGLGDEATWIVQTETMRYLFVAQGDDVVQVDVSGTAGPDLAEKGEAIARVVLTHL
jgi:hypothetical protein